MFQLFDLLPSDSQLFLLISIDIFHLIALPLDHIKRLFDGFQFNFFGRGDVENLGESDHITAEPKFLHSILVSQSVIVEENRVEIGSR